MRRVAAIGAAAVATLALAGTAQAATSTSIRDYGAPELGDTGFRVAFGQVFSRKDSCSAGREVKLVAEKRNGKAKLLDEGVTSAEGAISGGFLSDRVGDAEVRFVAPRTKRCGGASVAVDTALPVRAAREAVGTAVTILGLDGKKEDGAFAGLILIEQLEGGRKCFADRKVSLYGDGELLDRGTTTHNGTWAQHVTRDEAVAIAEFTVKVRQSKGFAGVECGGGEATYPEPLRAQP